MLFGDGTSCGGIEYLDKDIAPWFGQLRKLYELVTSPGNIVAGDLLEVRFRKIDSAVNAGGSSGFGGGIGVDPATFAELQREVSGLQSLTRQFARTTNGRGFGMEGGGQIWKV